MAHFYEFYWLLETVEEVKVHQLKLQGRYSLPFDIVNRIYSALSISFHRIVHITLYFVAPFATNYKLYWNSFLAAYSTSRYVQDTWPHHMLSELSRSCRCRLDKGFESEESTRTRINTSIQPESVCQMNLQQLADRTVVDMTLEHAQHGVWTQTRKSGYSKVVNLIFC